MIKTNLKKYAFVYLNANARIEDLILYLVFRIQSIHYTEISPMLTVTYIIQHSG